MEIKELGVVTGRAGLRVESLLETRSEVVMSELGLEALVETGMDVESILNTGKMLIFVLNQQVVLGRMYLDQEIETVTSSVNNTSCLMTH